MHSLALPLYRPCLRCHPFFLVEANRLGFLSFVIWIAIETYYEEERIGIPLISVCQSRFCVCTEPGHWFPTSWSFFIFMWEVIVSFVDFSWIFKTQQSKTNSMLKRNYFYIIYSKLKIVEIMLLYQQSNENVFLFPLVDHIWRYIRYVGVQYLAAWIIAQL